MKRLRHYLARLCWRAAFWLEGIDPEEIVGPRKAKLMNHLALCRLARRDGLDLTVEEIEACLAELDAADPPRPDELEEQFRRRAR